MRGNRGHQFAGSLHAFKRTEFLSGHHFVVNLREVCIGDVTKFVLCEIGNTDNCYVSFYLYPFVVIAVTETF